MRIINIDLESSAFTLSKTHQDQGDWVSICQRSGSDNLPDKLVWDGPIHEWLELRVLINDLHSLILANHAKRAFPAHEAHFDIPGEDI
jgi:hypothetical protein